MKRSPSALQRLGVLAVCVLFIMSAMTGIYSCFSQPIAVEPPPPESEAPQESDGRLTVFGDAERREDCYTILLGGMDDQNGGSDTNLLLSLDTAKGTINVLSLPRDTLLNVSWSVKKLNSACHHGGFERTIQEVENLLGIPVDAYITVDLAAFVELVDAMGGVTFDIPVNMDYDDPYQDLHIHFPAGLRHLTGEEALKVVRWRQNNDGTGYPTADIGRIGTQQAFLMAAAREAISFTKLDKLPEYAEIILRNVKTDLTVPNLIWLGEQALRLGSDAIAFHTLPGDGAGWYHGASYYILDEAATLELVNAHFNPYTRDLTREDMDILVP